MTISSRNTHLNVFTVSRLRIASSFLLTFLFTSYAISQVGFTRVILQEHPTLQERTVARMLVEEAHSRAPLSMQARIQLTPLDDTVAGEQIVVVANRQHATRALPSPLARAWKAVDVGLRPSMKPEAFSVVSLRWRGSDVFVLAGNDVRGELFAAGWLLRQMHFNGTRAQIPPTLRISTAPDKAVRGVQIGYRNKNNTYDAWNLAQFEQQIRDLAIFGANTVQLIAPSSDDDQTSVLYPQSPLTTLLGISALLETYGLDCDLYYPEMRADYSKPEQVAAELSDFEALVKAMPRLDALYVPGGDPGHTPPEVLFPLLAREVEVLHRYHPRATVWVSAQGFDRERYETFYKLLHQHPMWLTGVFFGPQSRDSFETQRRRVPTLYAMQFYPDIAHTMHAQFPIPQWDPVWGLTEGREPICPRPHAFAAIYRHYSILNSGFVTYSEGVNDDVNKMLWNQLGWSAATSVDAFLTEYARFFLHREGAPLLRTVAAIQGLEKNWDGPIATNSQIPETLRLLRSSAKPAEIAGNGRYESLEYRALYDDYVQRKLRRERAAETSAMSALAADRTAMEKVSAANLRLTSTRPDTTEQTEHEQLLALAAALFHDWGLQLSVPLYHAENWERGANLDRLDTPLSDAAWLRNAMGEALKQPTEPARLASLTAIVHWQHPVPGALYDDLGDPAHEPHLVRGPSWSDDPEMYHAAIDGIADRTLATNPSPANETTQTSAKPWRLSWIDYAETLYETPLTLHYQGLDAHRSYTVRITYAGEDYALPLQLVADGTIQVHPARLRNADPETVDFPLPADAIQNGGLTLSWFGPTGSGGSGRGRQVAEVWLLPQP